LKALAIHSYFLLSKRSIVDPISDYLLLHLLAFIASDCLLTLLGIEVNSMGRIISCVYSVVTLAAWINSMTREE